MHVHSTLLNFEEVGKSHSFIEARCKLDAVSIFNALSMYESCMIQVWVWGEQGGGSSVILAGGVTNAVVVYTHISSPRMST